MGRLAEATHECLRAIEIDAEFGNPYNDIGVYLMQQDKLDESIWWLEKGQAGQALRTPAVPLPEPGADLCTAGTLVASAPRVRGGCAAGAARRARGANSSSPTRSAELTSQIS